MTSSSGPGNNVSRAPGYDLQPGQVVLNTWEVLEPLGRGGMGAVYRVYHRFLQKEMAMKTLRPDQVTDVNWKRFQTEAKAIAKLVHPNIIQIFDMGTCEEGQPFYTMELLDGQGLDEWIRYEPITAAQALTVFRQVATALAFAHERGIVHRDIKPANIVLTFAEANKPPVVKVVDFGIAKLGTENQGLTKEGEVFGSPLYMSPEQATGQKVDHRSDIYSFGCALYETLTGFPPFKGKSAMETMMMHLEKAPLPIERARPEMKFPPGLSAIVQMMLAKDPDERYSSAAQIAQDLMQIERGLGDKVAYRLQTASQMVRENAELDGEQVTQRLTSAYGRAEREELEEEELEEAEQGELRRASLKKRFAGRMSILLLLSVISIGAFFGFTYTFRTGNTSDDRAESSLLVYKRCSSFYLPSKQMVLLVQKVLNLPTNYDPNMSYYFFSDSPGVSLGRITTKQDATGRQACGLCVFKRGEQLNLEASSYLIEHPELWKRFRADDIYALKFQSLDLKKNFSNGRAIDNSMVKHLAEVSDNQRVDEEDSLKSFYEKIIPEIARLKELTELDLDDTRINPNDMSIIESLPKLEVIRFYGHCRVSADQICQLPQLMQLREIQLPEFWKGGDLNRILTKLSKSKKLTVLTISAADDLTVDDFQLLGQIKYLEELVCDSCQIPVGGVKKLASLAHLHILSLRNSMCPAECSSEFGLLLNLKRLSLAQGINWQSDCLQKLRTLARKRNFDLDENSGSANKAASKVTDLGVDGLSAKFRGFLDNPDLQIQQLREEFRE